MHIFQEFLQLLITITPPPPCYFRATPADVADVESTAAAEDCTNLCLIGLRL